MSADEANLEAPFVADSPPTRDRWGGSQEAFIEGPEERRAGPVRQET
jgi:hypothetical protein